MPSNNPEMHGADVLAGMRMAADDIKGVQDDLVRVARESRFKVLDGKDREDFLKGMTQDELTILHDLAFASGPKGLAALERLMQEAADLAGSNGG